MREVIARVIEENRTVARSDGSVHEVFPVAASAAEGEALRGRVVGERATRTIEVGLGYGISALFVCEGLLMTGAPTVHHVAIDPYQRRRFAGCGLQLLDEAGVGDLVELHEAESQIVLPRFVSERRVFDSRRDDACVAWRLKRNGRSRARAGRTGR